MCNFKKEVGPHTGEVSTATFIWDSIDDGDSASLKMICSEGVTLEDVFFLINNAMIEDRKLKEQQIIILKSDIDYLNHQIKQLKPD